MIDMVDPSFAATRYVERVEDGYVVHVTPPPIIGQLPTQSVMLTDDQYQRYLQWREKDGMIQELLPDLSDSQREILMTGLDDAIFDKIADSADE
jgi:hypothetical protein